MSEVELPETVHFDFKHRLFSVDGCVFRKTSDGSQIALVVPMGEVQAALPVHQIRQEFEIDPESNDEQLMQWAAQALRYVRQIYPGDSIPSEVLTGKAPWMIEGKFLKLAHARIAMLVVAWKTDEDISKLKQSEILERGESAETKSLLENSYAEIAKELELGEDKSYHIIELMDKLGQELSYVEALRDKFLELRRMQTKLKSMYSVYQGEKAITEAIARCNSLIESPIKELFEKFTEFDTYMTDIVNIMRHFDAQVNFIRGERDAFRQAYMLWENLLEQWNEFPGGRNDAASNLVNETHRFAAQHFVRTADW
jgi:hypothetical protein